MTTGIAKVRARPAVTRPSMGAVIRAIALNTFREAIRDRILYVLLAFAVIIIVVSRLLSLLTVGSEEKIIKDVGLASIEIFGVLTALFVGVGLIFLEVERRTVQGMIALPLRREEFLLGKYLGLSATLTLNLALMSLGFLALLLAHGAFEPRLLLPIGTTPARSASCRFSSNAPRALIQRPRGAPSLGTQEGFCHTRPTMHWCCRQAPADS